MHLTDPPLRPSDPEAFRRQVYRRAARLRRRRVATAVTGAVVTATAVASLLFGAFLPLTRPSGGRVAIGPSSTSSSVASTQTTRTSLSSPSSTDPTSTSGTPNSTQAPTTTIGNPPPTTTPATTMPTVTTTPTTTVSTPTTTPPPESAVVPGGCGQPSAPATSASPAGLARDLVGTWIQCSGPSIFGTPSGGAIEIWAKGTWQQLGWTAGGWEPLKGKNDVGTWQLLPPPTTVATATFALVRFVANPPVSTSATPSATPSAPPVATPREWITRVMLTGRPHERAQFVEGTVVANYRLLVPSTSGASTSPA